MKTKTEKELEREIEDRIKHVPEEIYEQGGKWNYTDILNAKLEGYRKAKEEFNEKVEELKEKSKDNRTVSAARGEDCVLIETLNSIIDEVFFVKEEIKEGPHESKMLFAKEDIQKEYKKDISIIDAVQNAVKHLGWERASKTEQVIKALIDIGINPNLTIPAGKIKMKEESNAHERTDKLAVGD